MMYYRASSGSSSCRFVRSDGDVIRDGREFGMGIETYPRGLVLTRESGHVTVCSKVASAVVSMTHLIHISDLDVKIRRSVT